jgi:hypothetical protein
MENLKDFIDDVISLKNKSITDEVFLLIQNDYDFMPRYLRLVQSEGLDTVNKQIGKAVKAKYKLNDDADREYEPKSTLIKSHKRFL